MATINPTLLPGIPKLQRQVIEYAQRNNQLLRILDPEDLVDSYWEGVTGLIASILTMTYFQNWLGELVHNLATRQYVRAWRSSRSTLLYLECRTVIGNWFARNRALKRQETPENAEALRDLLVRRASVPLDDRIDLNAFCERLPEKQMSDKSNIPKHQMEMYQKNAHTGNDRLPGSIKKRDPQNCTKTEIHVIRG